MNILMYMYVCFHCTYAHTGWTDLCIASCMLRTYMHVRRQVFVMLFGHTLGSSLLQAQHKSITNVLLQTSVVCVYCPPFMRGFFQLCYGLQYFETADTRTQRTLHYIRPVTLQLILLLLPFLSIFMLSCDLLTYRIYIVYTGDVTEYVAKHPYKDNHVCMLPAGMIICCRWYWLTSLQRAHDVLGILMTSAFLFFFSAGRTFCDVP